MSEKQLIIEIQNGENVKRNMEKLWLQYQPLIKKISHKLFEWTHDYDDYLDFQNEAYFVLDKTVQTIDLSKIDDNFHIVTILKNRLIIQIKRFYKEKLRNYSFIRVSYAKYNCNKKIELTPLHKINKDNQEKEEDFDDYVNKHTIQKVNPGYNKTKIIRDILLKFVKENYPQCLEYIEAKLNGITDREYQNYREQFPEWNRPKTNNAWRNNIDNKKIQHKLAKYFIVSFDFCEIYSGTELFRKIDLYLPKKEKVYE